MSKFYFFTDIDLLNAQTASEAFGSVPNAETTEFRVTSMHSAALIGTRRAFAICNGIVKAQTVTDITTPELINLIIKPFNPGLIDGIDIKYIIYRGVLKSSLINGNEIAPANTNDLTNQIWLNQQICNSASGSTGNPSIEILGLDFDNNAASDSIDLLFYNGQNDFCSQYVSTGHYIGNFYNSNFGIQIILNDKNSNIPLSVVRSLDHVISVPAFPGISSQQPDKYINKSLREEVLNYIDPCAFYGMHYFSGIHIRNSNNQEVKYSNKTTNNLYNEILKEKFINHDVIYLDIRNRNNYSYVYYEDYDFNSEVKDFTIEDNNNNSITRSYTTDDWPIFIFKHNPNDTLSTDKVTLSFGVEIKTFESQPIICVLTGSIGKNKTTYLQPSDKEKFIKDSELDVFNGIVSFLPPNLSSFSKYFILPAFHNATSNSLICSFIKLMYITEIDSNSVSQDHPLLKEYFLDNVFVAIEKPSWIPINKSFSYKTGQITYLDGIEVKIPGIYEIGISYEANRRILFAMPKIFAQIKQRNTLAQQLNNNFLASGSFYKDIEDELKGIKIKKFQIEVSAGNFKNFLALREELFKEYWPVDI